MEVQASSHATMASTTSKASTSSMRRPLAELPLDDFVRASRNNSLGASPILKPMNIKNRVPGSPATKTPSKIASASMSPTLPATPPHSTTKPVNIRPHHPHVYHTPSHRSAHATASPSQHMQRCQTPDMLPSPSAGRSTMSATNAHAHSGRSRSDSSSSDRNPAPLARKRDRINPTEVAQARERVHQPIPGSPSPRKQPDTPGHSQHSHHRRNSSTASLTAFMTRARAGSVNSGLTSSSSLMSDDGNGDIDDDEDMDSGKDDDDDDDDDDDEAMVQVIPMKLIASPARPAGKSHRHRSSGSGSASFGDLSSFRRASLSDVFGVNASTSDGSLIVFQDIIEEPAQDHEVISSPTPPSPAIAKRRRVSTEPAKAVPPIEDKENALPARVEPTKTTTTTTTTSRRASSTASSSTSSGSGSLSPYLRSSRSPSDDDDLASPAHLSVLNKKKGTGGRLSLLASALDSDADSSRGDESMAGVPA